MLVLGFKDNTKKDECLTSQLLVNFHDTNGSARGEKRKRKEKKPNNSRIWQDSPRESFKSGSGSKNCIHFGSDTGEDEVLVFDTVLQCD